MTTTASAAAASLASPFELWCERNDLNPDDAWAWERYRSLAGELG